MKNKNSKFAIVKYIGETSELFSKNHTYKAFFVEYWGGVRNSLHVIGNDDKIHDFIPFEEFEVISDPHNVLNFYEAKVRCITARKTPDLTYGNIYTAIGRDKNGLYLVMDNSGDCYFYSADDFEILDDPNRILKHKSIYYSFNVKK